MVNLSRIIKTLFTSVIMAYKTSPLFTVLSAIVEIPNALVGFLLLYLSKKIIDNIELGIRFGYDVRHAMTLLIPYIIMAAMATVILVFLHFFKGIINERQQLHFGSHIEQTILEHSAKLGIDSFDNKQFYDTIATVNANKPRINSLIFRVIFLTSNLLSLIVAVTIALQSTTLMHPFLIIIACVPTIFAKNAYYKKIYGYEVTERHLMRQVAYLSGVATSKSAAKEVRFYRMAEFIVPKYISLSKKYLQGYKKIILKHGLVDSLFNVLPLIAVMFCLYQVAVDIVGGGSDVGDFMFLLGIFTAMQSYFISLADDAAKVLEGDLALQAYQAFLTMQPNVRDDGCKTLYDINTIVFENVDFSYPLTDAKVFTNLNLCINPRQRNAIIGINGAGKSTLVKLLLRFYDVTSGRIMINGVAIERYTIESVRKAFSVMFQDYITYSFSLRDNVAFSSYCQRMNDDKVIESLKVAGLYDGLPNRNLDVSISKDFDEAGLELSGGQKQKLAIARAVFANSKVLIMDEPDASLDAKSEGEILNKISSAFSEKGLIFISHRLANINGMDKIIVLHGGTVIEEGAHAELMAQKGVYYELYSLQAEKYHS